jgi:predicted kinase
MKELVILVANIGEGKTTLAKKYQEKGYIVVSKDSLRYCIGAGNYIHNYKYESIIWEIEERMLEAFMELGVNIVVDSICVSKRMRKRYINIAQYNNYKVKCHILPRLSMKEAVDRRMQNPHQQNDRNIWKRVWRRFDKVYENPKLSEGINKIIKEKKVETKK